MKRIPAFTVLLLMAVAAVVGIASIPMLNVQYAPSNAGRSITVSFSWAGASERIMEGEVTSVLEGVLSGISNCTEVSSTSEKGSGRVELTFRKGTDMPAVRFEVASRIRNAYPGLPDGVSYPAISMNTRGGRSRTALTYVIKSPLPSMEIEKYISSHVINQLAAIDGVDRVSLSGATPFELEVEFDSDQAGMMGITASEITQAFKSCFETEMLGNVKTGSGMMNLKLACKRSDNLGDIPITNKDGRIVHLGDIAVWRYKESVPESYFRLNGLNTIILAIVADSGTNLLTTVSEVKGKMLELSAAFPEDITASVNYDSSEYISSELDKIYFRTFLCVLILLVFVFLINRSWRYLFIITATLAVNILVAVVFYNIFSLPVHIYTLAGITVSLGIIIDTSIVMADHYSYYHDRKVFPALLGATATTIAALCVVLLLPEQERANLEDFSKVIIINLAVALLTAYFFVPSLIDRFPVKRSEYSLSVKRRKRVVRWSGLYLRYIEKGQRHRWAYILVMIIMFGIPLCLLPTKVAADVPEEERTWFQNACNKILSWKPYAENKAVIDDIAGTSFAKFVKAMNRSNFYREPGRQTLYVSAAMPEGCSVGQLNEVIKAMENYLSKFSEIETFVTRIDSYDDASIRVNFKPEYEKTAFPGELKARVTEMAMNFGGATWRVSGINDSYFNNDVVSSYKSSRINLTGYNYDDLYEYAEQLMEILSRNRRIADPEMMASWETAGNEYDMEYDFSRIAAMNVSPYGYYNRLYSILYDTDLGKISIDGELTDVVLRSSGKDSFDLWHVLNSQVETDSVAVKLSEIGSIEKKRSGLPINRVNQSYEIEIGYDYIGSHELDKKQQQEVLEAFNRDVLPVGYKAEAFSYNFMDSEKSGLYAALILLVIAIIYVMCSMIFESLRLPMAIILMIPISFVGVFLVFGLSDFTFDQGGFAAFVMLSGIVVNAGIYLINAFQNDKSGRPDTRKYVKAFNHKITAIMLTIISTVLGLIPFLFDGPDEVFWFAFAVGTIGGLVFSVLALIFFLPVFCFRRPSAK